MSENYEHYSPDSSVQSPDLSAFDDEFDSAEAPSFDEVPDGKYQVRVDSVRLEQSQKGDPMIKWDLIVLSGTQTGRHIFKNSVISQAALPYVKADLKTVGLELTRFSDLASRLEELLDITLEISKRTKSEYSNVYFNRRLQIATQKSSGTDTGDIPF